MFAVVQLHNGKAVAVWVGFKTVEEAQQYAASCAVQSVGFEYTVLNAMVI